MDGSCIDKNCTLNTVIDFLRVPELSRLLKKDVLNHAWIVVVVLACTMWWLSKVVENIVLLVTN